MPKKTTIKEGEKKIEIMLGNQLFEVTYDPKDFPQYLNTYGPNQEYREALLRKHILAHLINQNL